MKICIPSSAGDLIDRITILEVKRRFIQDKTKLKNIEKHLKELHKVYAKLTKTRTLHRLHKMLFDINYRQWQLEDKVRVYLRERRIDPAFARLVRAIHLSNDKRAKVKRLVDEHTGSHFVDEKHYA